MQNSQKSFLEMAGGAFLERADYATAQIMANIMDPNTSATAKRKMTITVTFKPDDRRENIIAAVETKVSTAPTLPAMTALYIAGTSPDGTPQVVEMTPQIPGQLALDGGEQQAPFMLKLVSNQ
jgi:hypothetical protein